MSKEIPCPMCCKHVVIDNSEWIAGGVFTCKHCGYKIKLPSHAPVSLTPDEVMLKKKPQQRKQKKLSAEEMDALLPKPEDFVAKISGAYQRMNPRPYIEITDRRRHRTNVEVGLKFSF